MAHMIPPFPKDVDSKSDEAIVFKSLSKLPDDYYVFHSVSVARVEDGVLIEREIDFVVANAQKGILCIEAKNGSHISYDGAYWRYSSGEIMKHDGPYNQVAGAKRSIIAKIKEHNNPEVRALYKKCKVMHAVFFFRMAAIKFEDLKKSGLPTEADPRITLLAEDLINPTKKIEDIFTLKTPAQVQYTVDETKLNDDEFHLLLDSVLCPAFNLIPSPAAKHTMMEDQLNQLLYEQYRLLDFLEDQASAVINGAAGTGKTMLAVEKARRHSINDEKVLFLCYNRLLCDKLIELHKNNAKRSYKQQFKNVDFMTISSLTKKITGNYKDYEGLLNWLIDCVGNLEKFGYKHVIVDEGQDFGLVDSELDISTSDAKNNCSIIDTIQEVVLEGGGTFYLFYDKYQMIQGGSEVEYHLPDCIQNSDCRLTLHCNCRNTKEIAKTSVTPLKDNKSKALKPTTAFTWFDPVKPVMHLVKNEKDAVNSINRILEKYNSAELTDIVLLTSGTIEHSCLADQELTSDSEHSGYYLYSYNGKTYKVSTCIKFKGLEADAIIIMDLNKDSFFGKKGLEFYVGTSRAKMMLDIVCQLATGDYYTVVHALDPNAPKKTDAEKMRKILGGTFSADIETQ